MALGGGGRMRCRNKVIVRCHTGTEWGHAVRIIVGGNMMGSALGKCGQGWAAESSDGWSGMLMGPAPHTMLALGQEGTRRV